MLSLRQCLIASHAIRVSFHRSLVRPLTLICLIVLFGIILPMWPASTPNALAWSASNLFQYSDFEGVLPGTPPSPWSVSPAGTAVIATGRNHTPGGTNDLQFNGNGANIDLKQRVNGLTAGQRYYLGSFGSQDSGVTGIAFGWGANNYPPPNYTNCAFDYAVWNGSLGSYGMMSCDGVVPQGYNYAAPKMSFNAASPHWAVTDDWYMVAVPNYTTSHYVDSLSTSTLYNWGCSAAQRGEGGTIILDFGQPWYNGTQYGTNTLGTSNPFASISDITSLAESFLNGYWSCGSPVATIVIGTSNCSAGISCTAAGGYVGAPHGTAWSQMIVALVNYVTTHGYQGREAVVGGSDIEPGWGTADTSATDTKNWITGYQSVPGYTSYLDYGSADGMPFDVWYMDKTTQTYHAGCPTCTGTNGWGQEDLWYVAWGASAAWPFPEIYFRDGRNAAQWYRMTLYALQHHSAKMYFRGTLTQNKTCGTGCDHGTAYASDNTPGTGWGQLMHFLNFDSSVYTSFTGSSDMTW